jgi:UDP-N-acetylmuramoyl-L-alanyl-D-glutamate--2,6-diaminopimelate ligase
MTLEHGGHDGHGGARAAGEGLGLPLSALAREIPGARLARGDGAIIATGVQQDSRRVVKGDVFVARRGARSDGSKFVADALARGAIAVMTEPGGALTTDAPNVIEVDDVPTGLAYGAAAAYGHPTFALEVIGITGTNGKTTTAHLVQAVIEAAGERPGIVGTLGHRFESFSQDSAHTSPEADELARVARTMLDRGATHLVMEVSSIALAAKRAEAIRFRAVAFTNLTQDHLDYHGSMEAYADAKARLFFDLSPGGGAVNVDDAFGREIAARAQPEGRPGVLPLVTYSAVVGSSANVAPVELGQSTRGIAARFRTPSGEALIDSPLLGAHNVANLACALALAEVLGIDPSTAGAALSKPIPVAGRLERCDDPTRDDVVVLVDYAHTPDALERVLASVRGFGGGKIICVFGCGGDRDPLKRPKMGAAVARGADVAIVTNDNPRSEDPVVIADAILPGLRGGHAAWSVELDRRKAIERAVLEAAPGDVVLLAGKGHEPYQILATETIAFDDRDEARRALALRREAKG